MTCFVGVTDGTMEYVGKFEGDDIIGSPYGREVLGCLVRVLLEVGTDDTKGGEIKGKPLPNVMVSKKSN